LLDENNIILDESRAYLKWNFFGEKGIAERISAIAHSPIKFELPDESLNCIIDELSAGQNLVLSAIQRANVINAVKSKLFILTGGPGTGKTTITYFIVKLLQKLNLRVALCSPTGRAAKRLSELTRENASTIHRLLEYSPQTGFQRNAENQLDFDAVIIDEFSMVDLNLFYHLLKAVRNNVILILIGDINQLPSVNAGNLLNDMIESGRISVGKLTEIFRQDEKSLIVINAHKIINNQTIAIRNSRDSDFFVIQNENKNDTLAEIINLFKNRLPAFGFDCDNIQLLAPVYKGELGVENLNFEIQKIIEHNDNPELFFQYGNVRYRLNDRIIQLKNNYNKNIMNGDIGRIIAVGGSFDELIGNSSNREIIEKYLQKNNGEEINCDIVIAQFDDVIAAYNSADIDECALAYAITVHKSQGSEFDCVIMPMTMDYYINLNRNLIYTGLTRAKKMCVIIGQTNALFYGIKRNLSEKRYSYLLERLKKIL